jgi:hypothetical protein
LIGVVVSEDINNVLTVKIKSKPANYLAPLLLPDYPFGPHMQSSTMSSEFDDTKISRAFRERLSIIGASTVGMNQLNCNISIKPPLVLTAPEPCIYTLHDVTVLTGEWQIITREGHLLDYFVQTPHPPFSAYLGVPGVQGLVYPSPSEITVDTAVLLGGCRNYCHWLFDYLPRLILLPESLRQKPILVNGDMQEFQSQSIEALGLKLDLHHLPYPGAITVRNLVGLSLRSICTSFPFRADIIACVRKAFEPFFSRSRPWRKVWISRAVQNHSRLTNAAEAEQVACAHGFEVVYLEHLTFLEQVHLFSEAVVVAGPHGAGFANGVFAPPGMRLIELMSPEFDQVYNPATIFSFVADVLGHQKQRIVCRPVGQCDDGHWVNQRYEADLDYLTRVLGASVQ